MKSIGEKLKQRRIELGYTIDDLHVKTKLSPVHLKAIEDGDFDYFKHDLSYLKFFLQYYCKAVYMEFEEIEDEYNEALNQYNETQVLKKIESTQVSNENIQRRVLSNQKKYQKAKGEGRMQFSRIDHQTLIVVGIVIVILAVLIFGFFKLVLPNMGSSEPNQNEPIINEVDQPEENKQEVNPEPITVELDTETDPEITISITEEDHQNYRIVGGKTFKINFTANTWLRPTINDEISDTVVEGTYGSGEVIEIPIDDNLKKITIYFGNLTGSQIYIDDQELVLSQQTIQGTPIEVNFIFGGN